MLNNAISTLIFKELQKAGIKTHYIETINDRDQICRKVTIIPLEVIVRNIIAGSMAQRLGIEEGTQPSNTIYDICYKKDELGDPLINDHHAVALGAVTYDELDLIYAMTSRINEVLRNMFAKMNINLVDFKIEFGRTSDGEIVLADEAIIRRTAQCLQGVEGILPKMVDEPTSALDPISTSKIEDLAMELKKDYTIVMVTHNMQQAVRVSDNTAFFLLGEVVEYNNTEKLFSIPQNKKTEDYITGRFG